MAGMHAPTSHTLNVREFGATGTKEQDARAAIQRAIDACAARGGGTVVFPPGAYTSGTLHLGSHLRIWLEPGATLYASKNPEHFDKRALFYGEDLENVTIEGRGTVDGQAEYEWRLNDMQDWYIYPNQLLAENAGIPLVRAFPTANSIGHLVLLIRCKDVRIAGLSFVDSPGWTMHPFACERLVIDGVTIHTSLQAGVWADGIDPDGCRDVRIANCTIETGDDALVFYSSNIYGPPRPCENITVTNCRLSSASSALKFCDGNMNAIRNVTVDNCVITGSNRGIAFMVFDGGIVEDVLLANLTVECKPFDWFWWGDGDPIHFNLIQRSAIDPNVDRAKEPPVGIIRNVLVRNVFARGTGPCLMHGHPEHPLENVTLQNVRLALVDDPEAPLRKGTHALTIEHARNLTIRDSEFVWEEPCAERWRSAIVLRDIHDLTLDGVSARQAPNGTDAPAILCRRIKGGRIVLCRAQEGSGTFLAFEGEGTQDVTLWGNDDRSARTPVQVSAELDPDAVRQGASSDV